MALLLFLAKNLIMIKKRGQDFYTLRSVIFEMLTETQYFVFVVHHLVILRPNFFSGFQSFYSSIILFDEKNDSRLLGHGNTVDCNPTIFSSFNWRHVLSLRSVGSLSVHQQNFCPNQQDSQRKVFAVSY